MASQTLFNISEDLMALDDLIYENEGNLEQPEVAAALEAFEAEIAANMKMKVDNYAAFIKTLVARADIRSEEAKRLQVRVRVDKNAAKNLADRLRQIFERHNIKRIDTPRFRVGVVNNGGHLPVFIDNPEKLPEEYRFIETTIVPNTDAIRAALAAGKDIPGCTLGERGRHLSIR